LPEILDPKVDIVFKRELYELRRKAILDRNSDLFEARAEGKAEGKAEGETEKAYIVARSALLKGAEVELLQRLPACPYCYIAKTTNLFDHLNLVVLKHL